MYDINNVFTSHKLDTIDYEKCVSIRNKCKELALLIDGIVPNGREKSLALTHLEEVMMFANAGISRNSDG